MTAFNRTKSCTVLELDEVLLEARGTFLDTVHEMNLTIRVEKETLTIVGAEAEMVRVPQPFCRDVQGREAKLMGIKIGAGTRRAVQEAVGDSHGCTHLAELALDVVRAVIQADYKLYGRVLSQEELISKYAPHLAGTCSQWTRLGEQIERGLRQD